MSLAKTHFPIIKYSDTSIRLFDRINKQLLVNRPEERVRLQWVDYFHYHQGTPLGRISIEKGLKTLKQTGTKRTDIVVYSRDMEPEILIECKAPTVPINASVAMQAARYNHEIGAQHIILSNGRNDLIFDKKGRPLSLNDFLGDYQERQKPKWEKEYWELRGFIPSAFGSTEQLRIKKSLNAMRNGAQDIRFLEHKAPYWAPYSFYYFIDRIYEVQRARTIFGFSDKINKIVSIILPEYSNPVMYMTEQHLDEKFYHFKSDGYEEHPLPDHGDYDLSTPDKIFTYHIKLHRNTL